MSMRLSPIFRDNAVFADGRPLRLFGSGSGRVSAEICGVRREALCEGGEWELCLPPFEAGGPYELTAELNGEKTVLRNIYFGTVILFAGQSNMEFRLEESDTAKSEYVSDARLRYFSIDRGWDFCPPVRTADGWAEASAESVGKWSAIGYLTGKYLRAAAGKAVGVINCSVGASVIRSWLPADTAAKFALPDEALHPDHFYPEYAVWNVSGAIYEKMLRPYAKYSLSGAAWYQGESNAKATESQLYRAELEAFFAELRRLQDNEKLKIALVQIADCDERLAWDGAGWREIQRAQEETAQNDRYCTLAVSRDICERDCIHPPAKALLSQRIAKAFE
ncbi:MAG: hypothetical protein IK047_06705 [Clostridia bacterium]|nr:hypothetical protein [Clostridia bacterium]